MVRARARARARFRVTDNGIRRRVSFGVRARVKGVEEGRGGSRERALACVVVHYKLFLA
jgi:hypothetical protein